MADTCCMVRVVYTQAVLIMHIFPLGVYGVFSLTLYVPADKHFALPEVQHVGNSE